MPSNLYRRDSNAASREVKEIQKRGAAHRENLRQQEATRQLVDDLETAATAPKLLAEHRATQKSLEALIEAVKRPNHLIAPPEPKTVTRATFSESLSVGVLGGILRRTNGTAFPDLLNLWAKGDKNRQRRAFATTAYKSMVEPASTTSAGWAAELVTSSPSEYFDPADKTTIVPRLSEMARTVPFLGQNSATITRRAEDAKINAGFVGEGNTIPVEKDGYTAATINRNKLAVITVLSKELAKVSVPNAIDLVRRSIFTDTAEATDGFMFDALPAVAGIRPAGLLNGVTGHPSAGGSVENVLADLKYLLGQMIAIRARKPVILINPLLVASLSLKTTEGIGVSPFKEDLAKGLLGGLPYIAADTMPTDQVYALDADSLYIGVDAPEIDLSEHASLVMLNDDGVDPTMKATDAVDAAGSVHISDAASVAGGPAQVLSVFQTNSIAMRYVQPVTWATARSNILAQLTGVAW